MSLVLESVAMRRHHVASGSSVPVCHIFLMPRDFRSSRMTSKLDIPSGLSMRKNIFYRYNTIHQALDTEPLEDEKEISVDGSMSTCLQR